MMDERINADLSQRVVVETEAMPWIASPQPGVERKPLDRIGGEVARATSLVRYAPASTFPPHDHALGEEFLVLEGVFADEHGAYPAGTYVRNPPGSRHAPRTAPGCIIFVKLRQMDPGERERVVIDTTEARWLVGEAPGHARIPLHDDGPGGERVTLERLAPGAGLAPYDLPAGEELFVLQGELEDGGGRHGAGAWIRNPPGARHPLASAAGAVYFAKRGHLRAAE